MASMPKSLTVEITLLIGGKSILRAWRPGVIQSWLDRGYHLDQAIRLARWDGAMLYKHVQQNLIVTAGRNLVADWSIAANVQGLVYHAIGTGTTAPAMGDTQLQTEQARSAFATRVRSANIATLDAFYTAAQANYNIKEAGVFGGAATGTANSGTLFSHYAQNYDNTVAQADLTFEYVLTITS